MSALLPDSIRKSLEKAGFDPSGRNKWIMERQTANIKDSPNDAVWVVSRWELTWKKKSLITEALGVELNIHGLKFAIHRGWMEKHGGLEKIEVRKDPAGKIWFFIEEAARTPQLCPKRLIGFSLSLHVDTENCYFVISDCFGLGDQTSDRMLSIHGIVKSALQIESEDKQSGDYFCLGFSPVGLAGALHGLQVENGIDPLLDIGVFDNPDALSIAIDSAVNWKRALLGEPPMQLIELQSIGSDFKGIDERLCEDDPEVAESIEQRLVAKPGLVFLMRRYCCAAEPVDQSSHLPIIESGVQVEPNNLSFLAWTINRYAANDDWEKMLKSLSRFVSVLRRSHLDLDTLPPINYVIPYLLFKGWRLKDLGKAKSCLERIIECCGSDFFVLQGLADLLDLEGDQIHRIGVLEEMIDTASSRKQAALVHLDLSKAKYSIDSQPDEALTDALMAVKLDPTSSPITEFATDLLLKANRYQEAATLLSTSLELNKLSDLERGRVHCRIGKVWLDKLNRVDLATFHFEKAVRFDPQNLESLSYYEQVLRESGDSEKLAEVLDLQYRLLDPGSEQDMEKVKAELSKLYVGKLGKLDKAIDLYIGSSTLSVSHPDEIARVLGWESGRTDWEELYKGLKKALPKLSKRKERAKIEVNLARLAYDKLQDQELTATHLLSAVKLGWIDPTSFNLLVEILTQAGRINELASAYLSRIDQVVDEEKIDLINQVLLLDGDLSGNQLDDLAIYLYSCSEDGIAALYKRFDDYSKKGDVFGLKKILEKAVEASQSTQAKEMWLETCLDACRSIDDDTKFGLIEETIGKLLSLTENEVVVLEKAVDLLRGSGRGGALKSYVSQLLRTGTLPDLSLKGTLKMFGKNEVERAHLLELTAERVGNEEEGGALYLKAADCYHEHEGYELDMERCIAKACQLVEVDPEHISRLRNLVDSSSNWGVFARALTSQVERVKDQEWRFLLLDEVADVFMEKLGEAQKAVDAAKKALKYTVDVATARFKVINFSILAGDAKTERSEIENFIRDLECVQDLGKIEKIYNRIVIEYDLGVVLEQELKSAIELLTEKGDVNQAGQISDFLISKGSGEKDLKRGSFVGAVSRSDREEAKRVWISMFTDLDGPKEIEDFIQWSKKVLVDHFTDLTWEELVTSAIGSAEFERLGEDIYFELKLLLGLALLNADESAEIALEHLKEVSSLRPDEWRAWIPVYLLMREYGREAELKDYLGSILDKVRAQPKSVRGYPVTLESLELEYARLVEQIGDVGEIEEHAFAMAAGGEAIVASPIERTPVSQAPDPEEMPSFSTQGPAIIDWRKLVMELGSRKGQARALFNQPFSNALEKHVAIQAVALLSGEVGVLEDWHWQVWSHPDQFGYKLSGRSRYPKDLNPPELYSPLHRLLLVVSPALVKMHPERFKKDYLAEKLNVGVEDIERHVKPVSLDHKLIRDSALAHYVDVIIRQKFRLLGVPGLQSSIFFEGENRSIYFDPDYFSKQPASAFFHKFYGLLWAIKLKYFVPLHLNPANHLLPSLNQIYKIVESGKIGRLIQSMTGQDPVHTAVFQLDQSEVARQFRRVGQLKLEDLNLLWKVLQEHIHRLLIAETLDVVGLMQSLTGLDAVAQAEDLKEQILNDEYLQSLLSYVTKLEL